MSIEVKDWLGTRKLSTVHPGIRKTRPYLSNAIYDKDDDHFIDVIGCTVGDYKWHIERQFYDWMRFDNYGDWHVDHIKPCGTFLIDDPTAPTRCHHWSNLRPLWCWDNCKRSRTAIPEHCPDYESLKNVTPRESYINEHGFAELIKSGNMDSLDSLDSQSPNIALVNIG